MSVLVNIISGKICDTKLSSANPEADMSVRATGRTTGQALRLIGAAMGQPGVALGIVDHHDATAGRQRGFATESLVYRMRSLIEAARLRGFAITNTNGRTTITYQPLVPVEAVVKEWIDGQAKK